MSNVRPELCCYLIERNIVQLGLKEVVVDDLIL